MARGNEYGRFVDEYGPAGKVSIRHIMICSMICHDVMMIHDVQSCPIADRSTLRGSRRGGLKGTLAGLGS